MGSVPVPASEWTQQPSSSSYFTSSTYVILAATLGLAYYLYSKSKTDTWIRYGVKEPKLPPFFIFDDDFRSRFSQLIREYGDTFGFSARSQLTLMTTNPTLMRHILIKDFNNFAERADSLQSNSPFAKSLFFAKHSTWKRHRAIVSPTFTSGKLKHIASLVDGSAQSLTKFLAESARSGQLVPIKDITAQYTGEIIARTGFGLDVSFIGKEEHEFLYYARTMIKSPLGIRRTFLVLMQFIPFALKLCRAVFTRAQIFDPISLDSNEYFRVALRDTIAERKRQQATGMTRKYVDFLDLLLKVNEAVKEGRLERPEEEEDGQNDSQAQTWEGLVAALSDDEVLGHSMLVIFAGMETTATTLQMCLYELGRNLDIQERLYKEIQSVVKGDTPTSEELSSLTYMEQVINETLRMYPPVPLVNRKAAETRTYEGITIPKGAGVIFPFFHIMSDPNNFPDPATFNPDRFSPEQKDKRDAMTFLPFGHGPRQCLGMRLALLELKVALVHVLRKVRPVVNEKTTPRLGETIKFTPQGLLTPVKPVMLAFELRA